MNERPYPPQPATEERQHPMHTPAVGAIKRGAPKLPPRSMVFESTEEMRRAAARALGPWYVGRVTRSDAGGNLLNAVKIVDNKQIEYNGTPTYSPAAAQALVDRLNSAEGRKT